MIRTLSAYIESFRSDESGQGLVEYSLVLALVSIATIGLLGILGTEIGTVFTTVTSALP